MMSEERWTADKNILFFSKRSVVIKLPVIELVKIALIFLHVTSKLLKTVAVYEFKLVWIVLHLSVKEFFKKSRIIMFYS